MTSRTTIAISGALALSLLLPSAAAVAQSRNAPYRMEGRPVGRTTEGQEAWRFESEEMRRRNMTPEEIAQAEEEFGAERMELARRIAELVEQGNCRDARALANEAGERQMALRVRQTCRAR